MQKQMSGVMKEYNAKRIESLSKLLNTYGLELKKAIHAQIALIAEEHGYTHLFLWGGIRAFHFGKIRHTFNSEIAEIDEAYKKRFGHYIRNTWNSDSGWVSQIK